MVTIWIYKHDWWKLYFFTIENEEGKGITVSTDTCWQKKGSGRAYNSLSGMPLIEFNPTRTKFNKKSDILLYSILKTNFPLS